MPFDRSMLRARWVRRFVVVILFALFSAQLVRLAVSYSATWDEAHHLYDGYTVWTKHDYRLNAEVPPLVKLVAAAPLLTEHLYAPPNLGRSEPKEAFLDGRLFVVSNGINRTLLPGRLACMLFPILLAWLLYVGAKRMFGVTAALASLLLFTFDPNVLANGTIISTDLGSACCFFAAVFAYFRFVQAPGFARWLVAALAVGLTTVAKFTGLLIIPMLLLLAVAEAARARSLRVLGKQLAACAAMLLLAWTMIWAFYGFRSAAAPHSAQLSPALVPYIESMPSKADATKLEAAARLHVLPQAYLWGLANTKKTEWEYVSYFFGHIYRHGPWQYFPAAFLVKSTLPLLLLLLLLPFLWLTQRSRYRRELAFLLVPVLVYFSVVTASHFDIGARHLMPIYPFLYVLAGAAVAFAVHRSRAWTAAAGALLLWQVGTSLHASGEYMAYGNEAWGGPSQVHRYLSDANVDWGQQLNSVRAYIDQHRDTECWFAYFPDGAVEPQDYGVHCHRLPTPSSLWWFEVPMDVPPTIEGTVFLSESDREGVESGDGELNPYLSFQRLRPVAVLQQGVYVYQGSFPVPLASALVTTHRSQVLARQKALPEALLAAQQAALLAPHSAIVQENLADRFAASHRWPEAVEHYRLARLAAQEQRPDLQEDLLQENKVKAELATKMAQAQRAQ